jgi:S-adenosylmethionine synthetase
MSRQNYLFTSESVSEGHPDKVSDRISDEVVDLFFREGPKSGLSEWDIRAACETLCTTNRVVIAGETRGPKHVGPAEVEEVARKAIKDIGYEQEGFHWKNAKVEVLLHAQSAHIAQGVDASGNKDEGAGDQGIMFGYACIETPALMPAPLFYSHKILKLLADARHAGKEPALQPDAKSQVTLRYENGKPVEVTQIVLSTQHTSEDQTSAHIREIVEPYIRQALPAEWINAKTVWHINPTGAFVIGGQGSDQGRPFGGLCRALCRQECRRRRSCRPLHLAARLCDRRGAAAVDLYRHPRHRKGAGGQAGEGGRRVDGPDAARHPQASRPQQADLRPHLLLRPFRPHSGQ